MKLDPYDLQPETPEPVAAPAVAPEGSHCRRCGYDLRGLPETGQCPECAASIARSLRGNRLELADPVYLRRLARGALAVELGVVILCALPIAAVCLAITISVTPSLVRLTDAGAILGAAALVSAGALTLFGWLLLTERDPAHLGRDESDAARLATRIATIGCAICWGAIATISVFPTVAAIAPVLFGAVLRFAGIALLLTAVVQAVASMSYLAHLARRVPDTRLVAEIGAARGVSAVCAIGAGLTLATTFAGPWCLMFPAGAVTLIVTLVFFVRYADVIDKTRRHLVKLTSPSEP